MSDLTDGQRAIVNELISESFRNPDHLRDVLDALRDDPALHREFARMIAGELEARPKIWQPAFYRNLGRKLGLGTVGAVVLLAVANFVFEWIDLQEILHETVGTGSFVSESLDDRSPDGLRRRFAETVMADIRADTSENGLGRWIAGTVIPEAMNDELLRDLMHQIVRDRPVLVYSGQSFLTVSIAEELPAVCAGAVAAIRSRYEAKDAELKAVLVASGGRIPDADFSRFQVEIADLQRQLRERDEDCRKVVPNNRAFFPFYADFGHRQDETFEVVAVLRVAEAVSDGGTEDGIATLRPVEFRLGRDVAITLESNGRSPVKIRSGFMSELAVGEVQIMLHDQYWDGQQGSALRTSELFHALGVRVDDDFVKAHGVLSVAVTVYLNKVEL